MENLIKSLKQRWARESVIREILSSELPLTNSEIRYFNKIAKSYSYMPDSFRQIQEKQRQFNKAKELFPQVKAPEEFSIETVIPYLADLKKELKIKSTDFKTGRYSHKERKELNLPNGHRAYNKRFRFLARFEDHLKIYAQSKTMLELTQISKSNMAFKIEENMITDMPTACFIAYLTASMNRRSMFTFSKQERAYDEIAEILFKKLDKNANWLQIAYVHPVQEVLAKLTSEEKGRLLGEWFNVMLLTADILSQLVKSNSIDIKSMIVRRGNDSSSWNEAAGAYNKARDAWINVLYSIGGEEVLSKFAPTKALRLMAADVAWGHRTYGEGEDPDTAVWNDLPKPWEILFEEYSCGRQDIIEACKRHNVQGRGWIAPRSKKIAAFNPTPELVHGVVISSPELAEELRKAGYFAGPSKKKPTEYIPINKEMDGLTVVVNEIGESMWDQENLETDSISVSNLD